MLSSPGVFEALRLGDTPKWPNGLFGTAGIPTLLEDSSCGTIVRRCHCGQALPLEKPNFVVRRTISATEIDGLAGVRRAEVLRREAYFAQGSGALRDE
jgi:hypothetical protein